MADAAARRVCILSHSHPEFSKGGGEMAAYRQFTAMRAAGRTAFFVGACEVGTQYAMARPIDTVMPFGEDEWIFAYAGMAEDRLAWDDPYQRRLLVDFLAGLDCDVYHFHHYWRIGADLIVELMEARPDATFVMTLHEMLAICLHHGQMIKTRSRELCRQESPLRCLSCFPDQTLERFTLRKATLLSVLRRFDHIFYPSEFIRGRYEAWGLAGTRGSVLENYLGDELADLPRPLADPAAVCTRFGFFGQPTPFKGLDVLVRAVPLALRENPDITVTVFGSEREDTLRMFPALEAALDEATTHLTFMGRYDPLDSVPLMQTVGWMIMPSIWWENSPMVIQESRRAGTPLIASDIGGMAEKVLKDVDGLHFKRGSPVDLARAMVLAAKAETRERFGLSVRDTMSREEFLTLLDAGFAPGDRLRFPVAAE
jgi:glycosyltransferase involved in cell wall biosynthesis